MITVAGSSPPSEQRTELNGHSCPQCQHAAFGVAPLAIERAFYSLLRMPAPSARCATLNDDLTVLMDEVECLCRDAFHAVEITSRDLKSRPRE
ncbi:hypothetical protein [Rathayibacter sp. Leaf248]|uniref:hypothetical protein n=1 Tax=Rathayibacter sp. Leaf248 TaxID=2876555 RepID=UPI001E52FC46|nr:hypothetical protein [Rathayibacter sp. Leaf248]